MIKPSKLGLIALVSILANCASNPNMHIGNDMYYASTFEQRTASQTIQQLESTPSDAVILGTIDASRCHRSFIAVAPTEETVKLDLVIAAYALGADAITAISIEQGPGLSRNCWHMLNGEATALILPSSQQTNPSSQTPRRSDVDNSLTDQQIRQALLRQSQANYSGSCACPFNSASNGSRCGGRSAYSRPGGASPLCYDRDITAQMITNYRARQ